jgi:hypothetical protein
MHGAPSRAYAVSQSTHLTPVDIENRTAVIPRKEETTKEEKPVEVWPLVEAALDKVDADPTTYQAAQAAMEVSDGCATLANFLISQAEQVEKMDYRFKVPLIVLGAKLAREDGGSDTIYDPDEGTFHFDTEDHHFTFEVYEDWTVDWERVADRVEAGYNWDGVEKQVWALDWLMAYLEVPSDDYMVDDEGEDDDQYYSRI